eukprot:2659079-Prymnesium_polylepis.1
MPARQRLKWSVSRVEANCAGDVRARVRTDDGRMIRIGLWPLQKSEALQPAARHVRRAGETLFCGRSRTARFGPFGNVTVLIRPAERCRRVCGEPGLELGGGLFTAHRRLFTRKTNYQTTFLIVPFRSQKDGSRALHTVLPSGSNDRLALLTAGPRSPSKFESRIRSELTLK